jgi:hypothetical protein
VGKRKSATEKRREVRKQVKKLEHLGRGRKLWAIRPGRVRARWQRALCAKLRDLQSPSQR